MSGEMRRVATRTEAIQVLRALAASLRAEAKADSRVKDTKNHQARAILALLKAQGQVKRVQKAAIRRELERAAADLEKRMVRIKNVPITSTERVLSKRKE